MNSEFSVWNDLLTKARNPNLSYCLHIADDRRDGFIPFLSEMQIALSGI